jgi:endonuclease YncB( thermonuclease family)
LGVVGSFVECLINRTVRKPCSISAAGIFLAVLCALQPAFAYELSGRVTRVKDGDSIIVEGAPEEIRLEAIDAPEFSCRGSDGGSAPGQPFADAAQRELDRLVMGKTVNVQNAHRCAYGRLCGKVLLDGRDIGLPMIRSGLAWHYKNYQSEQNPQDRQLYASAEDEAHHQKLGLWRAARPQPPWDCRHDTNTPLIYEGGHRKGGEPEAGMMILGNRRTGIYHWPGCPYFDKISPSNRVTFHSREEAEKAGYRAARNCP